MREPTCREPRWRDRSRESARAEGFPGWPAPARLPCLRRSPCGIVPGVPSVPSVTDLREKFRGWLHREPKLVVPRTILIVDNNAKNRGSTARLVESLGYQARQTATLAQALEQLDGHDPEFVLLAFDLDDASGLEALAKIRQLDTDLPV